MDSSGISLEIIGLKDEEFEEFLMSHFQRFPVGHGVLSPLLVVQIISSVVEFEEC